MMGSCKNVGNLVNHIEMLKNNRVPLTSAGPTPLCAVCIIHYNHTLKCQMHLQLRHIILINLGSRQLDNYIEKCKPTSLNNDHEDNTL